MAKRQNNAAVVDVCTKRLTALKAYAGQKGTIAVNGKEMKISKVIALYQDCLDSRAQLSTKRTEVKAAMAARANAESARAEADVALGGRCFSPIAARWRRRPTSTYRSTYRAAA